MPGIKTAVDIIEKFIGLGKELAKLPAMVLPQYQSCAVDFYRICKRILQSNENVSRWFHRFSYFDFQAANARTEFLKALQEYKTMKTGPEFQQLKFSCHDIQGIYQQNIQGKIASWFSDQSRLEEAEGIFERLTDADASMVTFVADEYVGRLDRYVDKIEQAVDAGDLNDAERQRLDFKRDSKEMVQLLERFGGDLSELVMDFASVAKIPVTLGRD